MPKKKHKKVLKISNGYYGRSKNCFRIAVQKVEKGLKYSYIDRKNKKRIFRALWIQRINASSRKYNLNYSSLINRLKANNILFNRKIISEMAIFNRENFIKLIKALK